MFEEDEIEEELQIMNEQDHVTLLSSESFEESIVELGMKKPLCIEDTRSVTDVIECMQKNNIGSVILTKDEKVSGIFTERDVLQKVIGKNEDFTIKPVSDYMTPNPQCLQKQDMIAYVLNNMHIGGYRHIPIVDSQGKPVSMVSVKDILSYIFDQFPNEISNRTGDPFRGKSVRESA